MIKTYVVVWNNVVENINSIESQITNYSVINSDAPKNEKWNNLGLIWYYKQLHFAITDFIENTSDEIFCWIAADIKSNKFSDIYKNAQDAMNDNNVWLYAPHTTHEAWSESACSLKEYKNGMNYSTQTDGMFFFIKRELVEIFKQYMDYLDLKEELLNMKSGWGVDYVWSSLAIYMNKYIIRDTKNIVFHPQNSSYNHGVASKEMAIIQSRFFEFCKKNKIDKNKIELIMNKISARMSKDPTCMSFDDFYNEEIIPYTIVSINDKRIINKDKIDKVMFKHLNLNIKSLNANNEKNIYSFLKNNKDFYFSWGKFKVGEVGCFASHYLIWKELLNSNYDYILVFEDDANIHDNFIDIFKNSLNNVPSDYDLLSIYVDKNQYDRFNEKEHQVNSLIAKAYQDWSTLCYVVSRKGAQTMIDFVKNNGFGEPVDWFIFRNSYRGNFNVYTLLPSQEIPVDINDIIGSTVQETKFVKEEIISFNKPYGQKSDKEI